LLTLDRDIGKPNRLSRFSRRFLPVGRLLVATRKQLLASLAIACSTLAGVRSRRSRAWPCTRSDIVFASAIA